MSTIALVTLSSQQKFAETEVASRMQRAVAAIGHEAIVLSADKLDSPQAQQILNHHDTLFSLCLHASIPKTWSCTSYVCLWDPFPWLKTGKYLSSLLSHDDYLVIDSDALQGPFIEFLKTLAPSIHYQFDALLPTVSSAQCVEPIQHEQRRLFYCGIGGENIFHRQTRLRGILKGLDNHNIVNLYGPKVIQGPGNKPIQPWQGYQSYQGEIPFDGNSLIQTMSQSGISLVVSSGTHREEGIPSARIFEACASGNVIIADDTAYFDRWEDSIYRISFEQSDEAIAANILKFIEDINVNPEKAYRMACQSQQIFLEHYTLEKNFARIFQHHEKRMTFRETLNKAKQSQSTHQTVYSYLRMKDCSSLKLKIKYLADKYHLNVLYRLNDVFNTMAVKLKRKA